MSDHPPTLDIAKVLSPWLTLAALVCFVIAYAYGGQWPLIFLAGITVTAAVTDLHACLRVSGPLLAIGTAYKIPPLDRWFLAPPAGLFAYTALALFIPRLRPWPKREQPPK
jgi:hypothetical protein